MQQQELQWGTLGPKQPPKSFEYPLVKAMTWGGSVSVSLLLSSLFSQQGRGEWPLSSAKFATGQRPFPAPLTAGDLEQSGRAESLEG